MDDPVQKAFVEFERRAVRIPAEQNEQAKQVHPEIRGTVEAELRSVVETFLSGSYSRRVQTAPRLKDIDIIVVLVDADGRYRLSSGAALRDIETAALASPLVESTEVRCRSVRATLHDYAFTVDLVGALPPPSGPGLLLARHMPEEQRNDWSWGNPRGQLQACIEKNIRCLGMYVPAVRLVKFWKAGACPILRSYHAESILWHALTNSTTFAEAMVLFFDAAYVALAPGILTPDPGAPSTYVDQLFEDHERAEARARVEVARELAHRAVAAASVEQALEAWAVIFGPSFPSPSGSADAVAAAMAAGSFGVTGTGVRPDRGRPVVRSRSWRPS